MGTSPRTLAKTIISPLGIAYRRGKDDNKKLIIDYKEGRIENALRRDQLGE
jgi:hypothetical protein